MFAQSELLAAVGLDHSTVSKSLRRMQEAGLLTREPAEHDRRVMRVSLTDKGLAMRGDLDAGTVAEFIATSGVIRQAIVDRDKLASDQARRATGAGGGHAHNKREEAQR